ncbi:MAG: DUF1573 domain-containing protein [Opitutaceae bacterium]|nr:DUF1573 domain-containing protein [Opitutaceae bacterium]
MRGTWHVLFPDFYFAEDETSQAIEHVLNFSWAFDELASTYGGEFYSFERGLEERWINIAVLTDRVTLVGQPAPKRVVTRVFLHTPSFFTANYTEAAKREIARRASSRSIRREHWYIDGELFHLVIGSAQSALSGTTVSPNLAGSETEVRSKQSLSWDSREVASSPYNETKNVRAVFTFKNTGYRLVVLQELTADCEGAQINVAQRTYCPGETGEIEVLLDGKSVATGKAVSIKVRTDDPEAEEATLLVNAVR